MNSRSEFVVAAVAEAQATIRAIDVKVAALLVAALAPVPLLASIGECFSGIYKEWGGLLIGATLIVFCVSWMLAIICYAMAIGAISSPSAHVRNAETRSGALYGPGIYKLSALDALINRSGVKSNTEPTAHLLNMPNTPDDIERELAFEHLKLIYIRDIKILRLRWGFRMSAISVGIGAAFYTVARYYLKQCGP
jgi:hypothetical protein